MHTPTLIAATLLLALTACGGGGGAPTSGPSPTPPPLAFPSPSPVGTPVGAPIQKVIGAQGGTLSSPDGAVTVEFPAGALSGDQTVGIQEVTSTSPARFGRSFRLTPEGATFAKPARLTFRYTDADLQGTSLQTMRVNFQTPEGHWTPAPAQRVDTAARTVTVETTHFSIWASLPGAVLFPQVGEVRVGQSLDFEVVLCDELPEGFENPYAFPVTACEASPVLGNLARHWSVNGASGGNTSVGTVTSSVPGRAVYTAPAKKPTPNPVAVSVQYNSDGAQVTLVSEVNVLEPVGGYQGTVTYTETGTKAWNAALPWVGGGQQTFQTKHTYTVTGTQPVDDTLLNLTFEQAGTASYLQEEHQEWKVYSVCQAGGPEVLREHHIYDLKYSMAGSLKAAAKGSLRLAGGQYEVTVDTASGQMGGPYAKWSWYQLYCGGGGDDDRVNRTETYPMWAPVDRVLKGNVGPNGELRGAYETTGEMLNMPTTIRIEWNLRPVTP